MTVEADPLSIGIVIPGHNFQRNFDWILEALAQQVLPGDRIVAVDDHSTEPIRAGAYGDGVEVDVAEVTGRGGPGNRSAARNVAWQRCDTALIMFLDGDMVPGPHSLSAIRALHARERNIVVKAERFALSTDDQSLGQRECLQMIADTQRWCEAVEGPDRTGGAAAANGPSHQRRAAPGGGRRRMGRVLHGLGRGRHGFRVPPFPRRRGICVSARGNALCRSPGPPGRCRQARLSAC